MITLDIQNREERNSVVTRNGIEVFDIDAILNEYVVEFKERLYVKERITTKIEQDLQKQYQTKTKLRFLKGKQFKQEQYFEAANADQCKAIMEIRLNMMDLKMNFKGMYDDMTPNVLDALLMRKQQNTSYNVRKLWS